MDEKVLEVRMYPREEHDSSFQIYVDELLKYGLLEGPAVIGIAKQIVDRGVDTLSQNQIKTFIEHGLTKGNYV
ncbi:hypothetical protein HF078_06905 [Bacillus sp. RO2]|uniref:hypothetical protein n=1 Tax=Bacillus sp. RO2 TaxID=2723913 RepID=UPI00145D0884|nr:hypothetical protein [Bacillus sp. RO2]NMH72795.1 hypothetical protein [Bacillus sp. RO2]